MAEEASPVSIVPQHTPGPWTIEEIGQDDLYGHVYITGHITSSLHTYCGNEKGRRDSITAPDSMTQADARLIAAAPLLLDALRSTASRGWEGLCWCPWAIEPGATHTPQCGKAQAALTAAQPPADTEVQP